MRFVDTNILLYRISSQPAEAEKQVIATRILEAEDLHLSVQVLQEFHAQATRSSRPDALLHEEAVALIGSWKRFPIQEITVALLDAALIARDRAGGFPTGTQPSSKPHASADVKLSSPRTSTMVKTLKGSP